MANVARSKAEVTTPSIIPICLGCESSRRRLLARKGVDGRVKHGHDEVGRWVIGRDGWYNTNQPGLCVIQAPAIRKQEAWMAVCGPGVSSTAMTVGINTSRIKRFAGA